MGPADIVISTITHDWNLCTAFKPLLYSQNSYIRNSAVEKLSNTSISENTIVCSFDIVSMYANIDMTISEELLKNKIEEYHLD